MTDIRFAHAVRLRGMHFVLMAVAALGACDSDPASPDPQAVEFRVTGAAASYTGGTAQLAGESIQLEGDGLETRGRFDGGARRTGTLVLDLWRGNPVSPGAQTTVSFDRFELAVDFGPGVHEVDLSSLPGAAMLRLSVTNFEVELFDDPCVLDTRVLTEVPRVDTDRVLYQGGPANIVAITFAGDDDYRGGNLFDDGDPRTDFAGACQTDIWDQADTVVCGGDDQGTACVYHIWGDSLWGTSRSLQDLPRRAMIETAW